MAKTRTRTISQGGRARRSTATKRYTLDEACALVKADRDEGQVRRDRRPRGPAGRRPEARRPDGARRGRAAARHRQDAPRRSSFAKGDKAKEAAGRRRRLRRAPTTCAKKIQEGFMDFDRVIATPGHDGRRRSARSRPRSARPHAEPEGRHGHVRRGEAPCEEPRPARSSTASRRRASSTRRSARPRSTPRSSPTTSTR